MAERPVLFSAPMLEHPKTSPRRTRAAGVAVEEAKGDG